VNLRNVILVFILGAFLGQAHSTPLPPEKLTPKTQSFPVITGEDAEFNGELGTDTVTGHAKWKGKWKTNDLVLTADKITYNTIKDIFIAEGNVTLTSSDERLLADRLEYHRNDGSLIVNSIRIGRYPLYIEGDSAQGNFEIITINNATVSYSDPTRWSPSIKAKSIVYSPGHYIRTINAFLGLAGSKLIPLTSLRENLSQAMTTNYFSLDAGYRSSLGAILDVGFHVPVYAGSKVGADLGLYSSRGIMFGPSGSYNLTHADTEYTGSLKSGFIHDYGNRTTDILGNPIHPNRAYAEWQNHEQMGQDLTLNANITWWKDSEILRDFNPKEFYSIQTPDSTVEATYTSDNYFASAFMRLNPNAFEDIIQRLPEIRFDLITTAIGGGFYERLNSSIAALRETPPRGKTLASNRFDLFYQISRPINPTSYFNFTPVVGTRLTDYMDTQGALSKNNYLRVLGEVGFDSELRSSGIFNFSNPLWDINGIRHLFTPVVSYRFVPKDTSALKYIPLIDRKTYTTYLQPIEIGDLRTVDQIPHENTFRLSLNNSIQTRASQYGSRDLLILNLVGDIYNKSKVNERGHSNIHSDFSLTPARWIEITSQEVFNPSDFRIREFESGIKLKSGDKWTLKLASDFVKHENNEYLAEATYRIDERFELIGLLEYGARQHVFNQRSIAVVQNLANLWRLEYRITDNQGPSREGHFNFQFLVDVLRF
jgi:LPS-assembly protein